MDVKAEDVVCCGDGTYLEPDIKLGTGQKLSLIRGKHTSERRTSSCIDREKQVGQTVEM